MNYDLIVCGASITKDKAWNTWSTLVKETYNWNSVSDVSNHGTGNEGIILKTLATINTVDNPFVCVMLTTFDKWDWFTTDQNMLAKFDKEKNPTVYLTPTLGSWGSGSHFPIEKEYYKENYYCQDYFTIHNLILINHLIMFCKMKNIPLVVSFDAPIFYTLEEALNRGVIEDKQLINDNTRVFKDYIAYTFYDPGLIGYGDANNINWRHTKFGTHPGAMLHYKFASEHILPEIDKYAVKRKDNQVHIKQQFEYDQKMWDTTNI